ncbi:acyl-CoA N-acyltransferase [Amylocarpus encephaloides]|uniref:Acyl-CoA N-acyltransferase n=1 Tax=Amylocarpus encephaloides TaxID=45428 RepID=A0A9P7YQ98_9HELO|nr:acyl-CoA N-acyltransferase [Amylocarpus encephaloides]
MGLVVIPALIPDIPKIYDIYFKAFNNEPMAALMVKILFPQGITEDFKKAHAASTLEYWHHAKHQYTCKCVDTDTGEIIGMALGDGYFHERSEEERKDYGVTWLEGSEKERAEKILTPLHEVRERLFGNKKYIYVHVVAVDPKNQGRKAGAALVQWGIDLGEQSGVPVYFESSPTTIGLYEKMGWHRLKETVVHKADVLGTEEDITVPLVIRFPSYAGNITYEDWKAQGFPVFKK